MAQHNPGQASHCHRLAAKCKAQLHACLPARPTWLGLPSWHAHPRHCHYMLFSCQEQSTSFCRPGMRKTGHCSKKKSLTAPCAAPWCCHELQPVTGTGLAGLAMKSVRYRQYRCASRCAAATPNILFPLPPSCSQTMLEMGLVHKANDACKSAAQDIAQVGAAGRPCRLSNQSGCFGASPTCV
jgi:hypothetical protein